MSHKDFLLEIGLEEIPARFVDGAIEQLKEKMNAWLKSNNISFTNIQSFSTPRRLALLVENMAEKQEDVKEEAKGPAKKIALDEAGQWTKAAQGFANSQGVAVDQLYFKEIKGIEYLYVTKEIKGVETKNLLPQLAELITGLAFPKNMRWGANDLKFVRPIRWLVALFGDEVVPFEITEIHSGKVTSGHRFLGQNVELTVASEYLLEKAS